MDSASLMLQSTYVAELAALCQPAAAGVLSTICRIFNLSSATMPEHPDVLCSEAAKLTLRASQLRSSKPDGAVTALLRGTC